MRLPSWRLVAVLAFALTLVAAAGTRAVRPYMRAASLVVRSAGMEQAHPAVAAWFRQRVTERDATVASRAGALRARAYVPDRPGPPAMLLVPGVHAMGIDEPRLIQFARQLAATGLTVVTPEIPDLKRYAVTPRSTDLIEDAVRWLTDDPGLCPGGRAGLIGISFAGGLSVVAAGRPSIADRLAFVVAFGGHGDFQRVVHYLCTGLEPDPAAPDSATAAAGDPALQPPSIRRPPHDYGVAVVALDLAGKIVPADQVAPLQQGILVFLEASHLALYDSDKAEREFARARAMEATVPEPAATCLHLVNTRDVTALGARLLPFVAALGDDPALSPERSPAPHAPVFLLHGSDDNVIPAVESRFLARHFEGKVPVRLLLSPLIIHAEVNRDARWFDVWQLIAFWASVSRR